MDAKSKNQLFTAVAQLAGVTMGTLALGHFMGWDFEVTRMVSMGAVFAFLLYAIKTKS